MAAAISCEGVTKRFGDFTAVDGLDLTVPEGSVFGYLGPNGAGKSTTIRMLMGLSRPTSGRVRVLGQDPLADAAVRRRIGYLPGELRLDDRLTVLQTLESWARLRGTVDLALRDELIERFALDPKKAVRGLSTGNRRKVGLVGAFMSRPDLLVLDEPTNGLDPLMQQVFLDLVAEVAREGRTVLLSSHILSEVERVAGSVAVLRAGRIVASGETARLRRGAAQKFHAVFTDEVPPLTELEGLPGAAEVTAEGQRVTVAWTGSPDALLRTLSRYRLDSLTAPEPDLEDAFFHHYRTDGDRTDTGGRVEAGADAAGI
ncbi:ABC transporter ATP-binding protein [Streptomyces megasporus]|uniref:ABC transporter ATP-binding protein n=1 Tax=Streptomyces megasporus TaxID=44060 RepID=UPI000A65646B|nr:ABC transporter ATP-binding protein [Streptomyces megasporus]